MAQIHEVNKRIREEIEKSTADENTKAFLLDILDFELERFDERSVGNRMRFRDEYERIINTYYR